MLVEVASTLFPLTIPAERTLFLRYSIQDEPYVLSLGLQCFFGYFL